jgi:hypothetical protein
VKTESRNTRSKNLEKENLEIRELQSNKKLKKETQKQVKLQRANGEYLGTQRRRRT